MAESPSFGFGGGFGHPYSWLWGGGTCPKGWFDHPRKQKKKKKGLVFKVLAKLPAKATRVVQPFLDRPYGVTETPPLGQMGVALDRPYGVVESTLGPNKGASATPKAHGKSFWGWLNYLQVP
jgi:hypothetical protein